MVSVKFAVTHVPVEERTRIVAHQRAELSRLEVILDPDRLGVWPTNRRALERLSVIADPDTTHVMVLADDMVLCRDFEEHVNAAVAARPENPVNVFSARKQVREAYEAGESWITSSCGMYGGSWIIPLAWVDDYLRWVAANVPEEYGPGDRRIAYWVESRGMRVWQTVPNLIQHVLPQQSLLGHGNPKNVGATSTSDPGELTRWRDIPTSPRHVGQCSGWMTQFKQMVEDYRSRGEQE